jgi:DNA recombination protein RmuC
VDINTAAIIISCAIVVFLLVRKTKTSDDKTLLEWLRSTNVRLDEQSRMVTQAARAIGEMSEIGRSMKDLQQFLASPKMRGGLGEQVLKQLLEESLPKTSFNLQYAFRSGVKVDAAIRTASGIIPIDSKFSMENFKKMVEDKSFEKDFQRDVKARIDEIATKYILPDEGTVDFALMYVPSESVYYEIVNSQLMDYAYKLRVMPVSPSTFYAFLRSVLLSFEGQKITAEIKTIQQALRAIHTETNKFAELLATLQSHVNNSYAMMNKVATQFVSLSSKVDGVQKIDAPSEA